MARAATSPELALYRSPGKATKLRAAIYQPTTVYTARVNHTFTAWDGILEVPYDTGSGTLANVLADMTMLIGTSAGAHDVGIVRLRSADSSKFYIGETSDVKVLDNQHLTVIDDFGLWARHVLIDNGEPFMDGGIAYSDQHAKFDPVPIMGGDRVLKLTGSTVSTTFNFAGSYVLDSTISAYSCTAPGSSSSSGMTTSTPTITWNSVGWKKVYLTLTAANGKTFFGVRYVYIWNEDNPPPRVQITQPCQGDADEGGFSAEITMLDECDVDTVRDHALIILFGDDRYGNTQSNIGPVTGCENIYFTGWIARETIDWNPEQGSVRFTAYGAHYWFAQIPSYPDGVELVSRPAAAWTEMQGLTARKGLFHFFRWRTTATRMMDVFLPDDTKYTKEVSSLAQSLWEQVREMAFLQIFARAICNEFNQLYIEVHPQLVAAASRTWPTVMTITKADWVGEISLERVTRNEVSQVNLSGVGVNEAGRGTPYFSLSTGHTHSHYGKPEIQENLLVSSQADANQKAGLYYGWRNNPYPDVLIVFDAAIRLISIAPRQKCNITIDASDTPRGNEYSGGLIPKSVAIVQDPDTGYVHREVTFEAETFEAHSVNGDVPGSGDVSVPPIPPLPPLPPIEILIPGTITPTKDGGPPKVIAHSTTVGILNTENFDADGADVDWLLVNPGLTQTQYQQINYMEKIPGGGILVACRGRTGFGTDPFIAYAPFIGATFTIIEDLASIAAKYPSISPDFRSVNAIGINPLTGQVAYVIGCQGSFGGDVRQMYVGSGTSFAAGVDLTAELTISSRGRLSFGFNNWRLTGTPDNTNVHFIAISADGGSIIRNVNAGAGFSFHVPVSTTDAVLMQKSDSIIRVTSNGAVAGDFTTLLGTDVNAVDFWDNHTAIDPTGTLILTSWDLGQRGKSSDGGSSFTGLPTLPFGGDYAYDYAGGAGAESRWVAAGGIIRYSPDFGNTWLNKEGNLSSVAPIPSLNIIRVVEY
jgi:hypothetical protein